MAKAIVFCADGTWNGPGKPTDGAVGRSNVYKTFANLAGSPAADPMSADQERVLTGDDGTVLQVAKYLHGVGNSGNLLVRALGGAAGLGLIARVVRGYTFISRNYAAGDRIYIVGFSRGAYTARALAGLISAYGLIDASTTDLNHTVKGYRLGLACWYDYRRRRQTGPGIVAKLRRAVVGLAAAGVGPVRSKLVTGVPVEAVAVWDTVGSLGIPIYTRNQALVDMFQFADRTLSPAVRHGVHAVAIDEMRGTFQPTLWDRDPQRVTQVLFAGAHANVGGGYDHSGLSDIAYKWMAGQLAGLGVAFAAEPAVAINPDPYGPSDTPWLQAPWTGMWPNPMRSFPTHLRVKQEVVDRMKYEAKAAEWKPYKPVNTDCFGEGSVLAEGVEIEP